MRRCWFSSGFLRSKGRCSCGCPYTSSQGQGTYSVSIGNKAGSGTQEDYSVAIGSNAGLAVPISRGAIVIAANGGAASSTIANACVITPIRNLNGPSTQRLFYSILGRGPGQEGEITWGAISSSIRYKQDIVNLPRRYIDAVFKLKPVEFAFKTLPNKRTVGLIAEDVVEHVPEIVTYNALDDKVIEGLDIERLIAPLVVIAQQHVTTINALQAQLKSDREMLVRKIHRLQKRTS